MSSKLAGLCPKPLSLSHSPEVSGIYRHMQFRNLVVLGQSRSSTTFDAVSHGCGHACMSQDLLGLRQSCPRHLFSDMRCFAASTQRVGLIFGCISIASELFPKDLRAVVETTRKIRNAKPRRQIRHDGFRPSQSDAATARQPCFKLHLPWPKVFLFREFGYLCRSVCQTRNSSVRRRRRDQYLLCCRRKRHRRR